MLAPVHPGVYAVGHRSRDRLADLWAAWLYVGDDAVLSHQSAGELWEIHRTSSPLVALSTPRKLRSRPGLRIHSCALPTDEVTERHGLPVTIVSRTVLDLAAILPDRPLERVLEECERRQLGDPLGLETVRNRYRRRRGAGALSGVLRSWQPGASWTRSELEERFLRFLDAQAIPRGEANARVRTAAGWFECDHVWRRERLVVELDGRAHHAGPAALERDSLKRRALAAAGWTVVVVTWRQLHDGAAALAADLRRLLGCGEANG